MRKTINDLVNSQIKIKLVFSLVKTGLVETKTKKLIYK